ncbi:hypothetical protein SBOR_4522 [Sclerotinia borealis F-4128]|uniref:Uncharacterized protein n=1 Tax=Sclerotinia borealis (strain F-4128) TaxID=1432307 RepID=W9CE75_SCLBF|nr:hypothetical protein SBOR_4522 [Sclerotinia borealis F-4128]
MWQCQRNLTRPTGTNISLRTNLRSKRLYSVLSKRAFRQATPLNQTVGIHASGFTATSSAIPELQAKHRKERGLSGGIIGIFYACGFLIPVGESVHSFFQPKDGSPPVFPPYCKFHKHGMHGVASVVEGAKYFFNGLDETRAKHYESTLTASAVFRTVLHNDAYSALPSTYLVTEQDLALPAAYQEGMIALQNSRPDVNIGMGEMSKWSLTAFDLD